MAAAGAAGTSYTKISPHVTFFYQLSISGECQKQQHPFGGAGRISDTEQTVDQKEATKGTRCSKASQR